MNSSMSLHRYATPILIFATIVMGMSFAEGIVQFLGFSLIAGTFSAGRILDIAATLYLFGIALLLVGIQQQLSDR